VVLSGLQSSTKYYWQVTTPGANSSTVLSFTTAHAAGDAKSYVVAVNGDMGLTQMQEGATQSSLRQYVNDGRIDWFMHIGDAGYADDWEEIPGTTYESVQEEWMNKMAGIWTERPYMVNNADCQHACIALLLSLSSLTVGVGLLFAAV
jgi:phosphodiesterase/alkaline phosphatase D-like protein